MVVFQTDHWAEMVICFNGDVILCCNDMAQQEILGNLKHNTIEDIWNGNILLKKINQIYCGEPSPENFICKQCEFARTSTSLLNRLVRNVKYEVKKYFLTFM